MGMRESSRSSVPSRTIRTTLRSHSAAPKEMDMSDISRLLGVKQIPSLQPAMRSLFAALV